MKHDLPAAAVRLSTSLPVHTHERIFYQHKQGSQTVPQIIIAGKTYRSRLESRRMLHIGAQTLNDWLRTGRAKLL